MDDLTRAKDRIAELHLERASDALARELTAKGYSADDARAETEKHRERLSVDDKEKVTVRLHSGGVVEEARGIGILASEIYLRRAKSSPDYAEAVQRRKEAMMRTGGIGI